ncbi:Ldh family oxidoreductase [Martelella radicis]|uniref:L-lactate dehydrogenase n=1 Tax=Martelella radicis TaxID=1397476 RepID=A0A7W6PC50_9HYPH|nr:Ldh family oxidoreductase [Martelella radicis]MBB4124600.1 L-lactate dehydrogenase [Martelella radicis]
MTAQVFTASDLVAFASEALAKAGLSQRFCQTVASILVEGDLMGHTTHGLALLPAYLASMAKDGMTLEGDPEVLNERPAAALWDGRLLPGPWLISEGFRTAVEKAGVFGTYSLSIRRSHHTASLVSYLKPVTDRGMMAILAVSDPTEACVAPFGAAMPVLSTNPIAFGIPGVDGAAAVDISTSETTNGMVNRFRGEGRQFGHEWLIDAEGRPSRDPAVRFTTPPGAIMPLGGFSSGHKGTGLGMTVEALTHGLSGNGRKTKPEGWQANVFLQVIDPDAFGGVDAFLGENSFLAQAIRDSRPADRERLPRVPGERGRSLRQRYLNEGVPLSSGIVAGLQEWADRLDLAVPETDGSDVE